MLQDVTTRAEDVQSNGRADLIAEHRKGMFIFELKVDEPVDKAFLQIRVKGYAEPYLACGKPIRRIASPSTAPPAASSATQPSGGNED